MIGAPILDAAAEAPVLGPALDLGDRVQAGRLRWQAPSGPHALFALYQSRTSHVVLGAAFAGAAGDALVIDHLDPSGSRWLIEAQRRPWLAALGADRPQHLFIDSLERSPPALPHASLIRALAVSGTLAPSGTPQPAPGFSSASTLAGTLPSRSCWFLTIG